MICFTCNRTSQTFLIFILGQIESQYFSPSPEGENTYRLQCTSIGDFSFGRRHGHRRRTALVTINITLLYCSTCVFPHFNTSSLHKGLLPLPRCFPVIMVDLFLNRVLVENNWDQDELNTEREIIAILENRIVLLFFASSECKKCQEFLPVLNDFFKRLKDPAYIEYPKLLALIFVRSLSFLLFFLSL